MKKRPGTFAEHQRAAAKARTANMTPEQLSAHGTMMTRARWKDRTPEERSAHAQLMLRARWGKSGTVPESDQRGKPRGNI